MYMYILYTLYYMAINYRSYIYGYGTLFEVIVVVMKSMT